VFGGTFGARRDLFHDLDALATAVLNVFIATAESASTFGFFAAAHVLFLSCLNDHGMPRRFGRSDLFAKVASKHVAFLGGVEWVWEIVT
jgi:hypothetical protein